MSKARRVDLSFTYSELQAFAQALKLADLVICDRAGERADGELDQEDQELLNAVHKLATKVLSATMRLA